MNVLVQNTIRNASLKYRLCIKLHPFLTLFSQRQERSLSTYTPNIKENSSKMKTLLPTIIDHVTESTENIFTRTPQLKAKLREIINYNLVDGKMIRAMIFLITYQRFTNKNSEDTEDSIFYAALCIEMFLGYILILDDILDQGTYRRGKSSWYYKNNQNLIVMYDALLLYDSMYAILKKFFRNHDNYIAMVETFLMVNMRTNYGQILDATNHNYKELTDFGAEFYELTAVNKTAYATFYLPTILALYASKHFTPKIESTVQQFSQKLGYLGQIQDDYLDCYGDPNVTGKLCTDIAGGKCTWLLIEAIKCCDKNQLMILEKNYGDEDPNKVQLVKTLFTELELKKKFVTVEENLLKSIEEDIQQTADPALRDIFNVIRLMLTGRRK